MHKGSKDVSYISLLGGVKLLWYVYTCKWHLKVVSFQRDMLHQNECVSHLRCVTPLRYVTPQRHVTLKVHHTTIITHHAINIFHTAIICHAIKICYLLKIRYSIKITKMPVVAVPQRCCILINKANGNCNGK